VTSPLIVRAWLLTGRPGVGKTTCLRRTLEQLAIPVGGFFTEEVREQGQRVGFALVTPGGQRAILAHIHRRDGPRVGKYRVDLEALDQIGVPAILDAVRRRALVVIDEIGKMEMASPIFCRTVEETLQAEVTVLGTILRAPHPWADRIKGRRAVAVVEVTPANRDELPARLAALVRDASGSSRPRARGPHEKWDRTTRP
jgi:nucleoside-triphosphatase